MGDGFLDRNTGFLPPGAASGSGPTLSDATPAAPGTAAAGVSADASRADHVHAPLYRFHIVTFIAASPANTTSHGYYVAANTNYPYWIPTRNCVLVGISAMANSNPSGSAPLFRLTKTQVPDTTLTLTGAAGSTRNFWTTGTGVAVSAGDKISACIVTDASWTATTAIWTVSLEFEGTV